MQEDLDNRHLNPGWRLDGQGQDSSIRTGRGKVTGILVLGPPYLRSVVQELRIRNAITKAIKEQVAKRPRKQVDVQTAGLRVPRVPAIRGRDELLRRLGASPD